MDDVNVRRERLVQEIDKLPADKLDEVLDFVEYLLSQEQRVQALELESDLDPAQDPILRFIGGISHGSLAKDIDKELYRE